MFAPPWGCLRYDLLPAFACALAVLSVALALVFLCAWRK
jgi:hypothetical protein